ncbi:hypothetical protein JBE04_32155 [Streptomyces sp. PRKS01-29]|nr:hypothetical protein [Streptomyces sabulosicollis]MBI0298986.1 hypothetical protein [Streptomyces sabulosicollis]
MPQDLSAVGAEFVVNPYPVDARLRERGPVHRVRKGAPLTRLEGSSRSEPCWSAAPVSPWTLIRPTSPGSPA